MVVDGDLVLVLRHATRGEVRLPKGHIEDGESAAEAARREVGEETGYLDLDEVADLGTQHVTFRLDGDVVERDEHYFLFRLTGPAQRARNHRDRRFDPTWLPWADALAAPSYPAEQTWVMRAAAALGVPLAGDQARW